MSSSSGARRTSTYRGIEALRGAWGAALLVAPDRVLGSVDGLQADTKSRVVARVLGARQLTQAVLSGLRPSPEVLAMGVWVDAVHALTAIGLAVVDPDRARAGATDTAIAGLWATAGYRDLRRGRAGAPSHQRRRDQLATVVLRHVPGAGPLRRQLDADHRRDTG